PPPAGAEPRAGRRTTRPTGSWGPGRRTCRGRGARGPSSWRSPRRELGRIGGVLLHEVVATSSAVRSTRARLAKVAALAELLARLEPEEVEATVALLAGEPRQGKVGVGWATLRSVDVPPASEPSLPVLELDGAIRRLQALSGPGSAAARSQLLTALFARATAD